MQTTLAGDAYRCAPPRGRSFALPNVRHAGIWQRRRHPPIALDGGSHDSDVDVLSLTSDALIWAVYVLLVVGAVTLVALAIVAVMAGPGGRLSTTEARATYRRVVMFALVAFVAVFFGGLLAGALQ